MAKRRSKVVEVNQEEVTNPIRIVENRDYYIYTDSVNNIKLIFPICGYDKRGNEVLESPITAKKIRNLTNMTAEDLISYHISKQKKRHKSLKQVKFWLLYLEYKKYYGSKKTYYDFIRRDIKQFANYGYSNRIITPQVML